MKSLSEKPKPTARPGRETALGFLAANMAVPGTGTFLAGQRILGVFQVLLAFAGMGMTIVLGLRMAGWMLGNWNQLHDPYGDPAESLAAIWNACKWPLAGIATFAFAWIWSVLGSLRLLRSLSSAGESGQKTG